MISRHSYGFLPLVFSGHGGEIIDLVLESEISYLSYPSLLLCNETDPRERHADNKVPFAPLDQVIWLERVNHGMEWSFGLLYLVCIWSNCC